MLIVRKLQSLKLLDDIAYFLSGCCNCLFEDCKKICWCYCCLPNELNG